MPTVNNASLYGKNSAGVWKPWDTVYAKQNGVWKFGMVVWVKDEGEWKQVFVRLTAPTNLTRTFASGSKTVTLNWTPGIGADGFRVYNGPLMIKEVTGGATSTTTVELDYYTTHSITVRAYSGATESDPTNTVTVYNTITAPSNLSIAGGVGTKEVTLSWTAGSGQTTYYIYRGGVKISETTNLSFTTNLPDYYTNYTFDVRGFYGSNTSEATSATKQASMAAPTITNRTIGAWTYTYKPNDPAVKEEWTGNIPTYTMTWSAVDGALSYEVSRNSVVLTPTTTSQTISIGSERNTTATWSVRAKHSTGNLGPATTASFYIGRPFTRKTETVQKTSNANNPDDVNNKCMFGNAVRVTQPANSYLLSFRVELTASFITSLIDTNDRRNVVIDRPASYGGDFEFLGTQQPNPLNFDVWTSDSRNSTNNFGYNAGTWGVRVYGETTSVAGGWSTFGLPSGDFYIGFRKGDSTLNPPRPDRGNLLVRIRARVVDTEEIANGIP
jgi:hypothetical protein